MALIDRVELAAYHDSRIWLIHGQGHEKWQPEFLDTRLDFQGDSSIVAGMNGIGKSTVARGMLALLSRKEKLIEAVRGRMAPTYFGHYSHIRIEIVDVEWSQQTNMLRDRSGKKIGKRFVFGMYGNYAGTVNFYHYEGELEDCPVTLKHGKELIVVKNEDFYKNLEMVVKKQGGKIGSSAREWRDNIGNFFEIKLIDQLAKYQTSGGGEGDNKKLINVVHTGRKFDQDLFFQYVAPEFLPDAMGEIGSNEEESFEHAVVKSLRSLFQARYAAKEKAEYLEGVKGNVDSLRSISGLAQELIQKRSARNKAESAFLDAYSTYRFLMQDSRLPGIPPMRLPKDSSAAAVVERGFIVQQDNDIYILDKGLAWIIGEEPKETNNRAKDKKVESKNCQILEVIEIPVHHGSIEVRPQGGGHSNKLYSLDAAIMVLNAVTKNFTSDWTKETAIVALKAAFEWAETNDIRRKVKELRRQIAEHITKRELLEHEITGLEQELNEISEKLSVINTTSRAYDSMVVSGLFTDEELSEPAETKNNLLLEKEEVEQKAEKNRIQLQKLKKGQESLAEFKKRKPSLEPSSYIRERTQMRDDISQQIAEEERTLTSLRLQKDDLHNKIVAATKQQAARSQLLITLQQYVTDVKEYESVFSDENPEGLKKRVESDYEAVKSTIKEADSSLAAIEGMLGALWQFRREYPADSPQEWINRQIAERNIMETRLSELRTKHNKLEKERKHAENHKLVPEETFFQALALCGEGAVPLYEAVRSFGFAEELQRSVLSLFSALLFSPVIESPSMAIAAAAKIDERKLDCPVFVLEELRDFCTKADIHSEESGVHAVLAGSETERVACILDPQRIASRIAVLKNEIAVNEKAIQELESSIEEFDKGEEKKRAMRGAHLAAQAIEQDAEAKEAELLENKSKAEEQLPRIVKRYEAKHLIGSVLEFVKLGGFAKITETEGSFENITAQITEMEKENGQITGNINAAEEALRANKSRLTGMEEEKNIEEYALLAVEFLDKLGGEKALHNSSEEEKNLNASAEKIKNKLEFNREMQEPFILANTFVKQNGPAQKRALENRRSEIEETIKTKRAEEKNCSTEREELGRELESTAELSNQYSNRITDMLKRYRAIKRAAGELSLEDTMASPSEAIVEKAEATIAQRNDFEALLRAISGIVDEVSQIDVTALAKDYEQARDTERRTTKTFKESLSYMLTPREGFDRSTLPAVIGAQMKVAFDKDRPELVEAIYQQFTKDHAEAERQYNEANKVIEERRTNFSKDMANLAFRLRSNYKLCVDAMKPNADGAGFIIKASILKEEARAEVIEHIVSYLEEKYGPRVLPAADRKASSKSEKDIKKEDKQMIDYVKDEFYKQMFIDPSIHVQFPGIAGGTPIPLPEFNSDDGPSGGQSDAILLLWLVKFGDFIIKRGDSSEAIETDITKRKRIEKAIAQQRRRHRVYIIDGIFAKLSHPEYIRQALSPLKNNVGKFQLIGFMHNMDIATDFSIFPTRITLGYTGPRLISAKHEFADNLVVPMHVHVRER